MQLKLTATAILLLLRGEIDTYFLYTILIISTTSQASFIQLSYFSVIMCIRVSSNAGSLARKELDSATKRLVTRPPLSATGA